MTDTPPDWVLIEAAKRVGWGCGVLLGANTYSNSDTKGRIFRALCDMIQKYEQPPVDRKVLCAREASTFWHGPDALDGSYDSSAEVCCSIRAIELWEEGFGK
jgi:hypothetical protein